MKQTVFLVDDHSDGWQMAMECLENAGYTTRIVAAQNLIEEAQENRPSLILTGVLLPDGNGLDLCRKIRENRALARTPLVFVLPKAAEEHRALALESGGDDCIVTPFSPRELVARVQAVLRRFALPAARPGKPADLIIDS